MKFLATIAPFLALAAAAPSGKWEPWCPLTDARAQEIAAGSAIFLSHTDVALANTTAQGLFAANIQEYGDSINSLLSEPIGQRVENGVATYIMDTLSSPPIPSVTTLGVVHDCTQMVWFWQFDGIGSSEFRVRGMTFIHVNSDQLVDMQNVEFNSLAWGADIGFQITPVTVHK